MILALSSSYLRVISFHNVPDTSLESPEFQVEICVSSWVPSTVFTPWANRTMQVCMHCQNIMLAVKS